MSDERGVGGCCSSRFIRNYGFASCETFRFASFRRVRTAPPSRRLLGDGGCGWVGVGGGGAPHANGNGQSVATVLARTSHRVASSLAEAE